MSKEKKLHLISAPKIEHGAYRAGSLPELPGHHGDALESVVFSPRREMTLEISPLRWAGNRGYYGTAIVVRFGGIVNFDEVQALFKPRYCKESELDRIRFDEKCLSKPGDLHLLLSFERISVLVPIHCQSLTLTEPDAA